MQMYGCRVVQKALEYVSTQRLIALVSEFENPPVLLPRGIHPRWQTRLDLYLEARF